MKPDASRETAFADLVDRVVAWPTDGQQFGDAAFALSSNTRLAVLEALVTAKGELLHIQEVARRVGIDASPARQHLEVLVKAGFAEESPRLVGRERRFSTRVTGVKVVLEGALRGARLPTVQGKERPKTLRKVESKIDDLKEKMAKIRSEVAKLEREREKLAREMSEKPAPAPAKG